MTFRDLLSRLRPRRGSAERTPTPKPYRAEFAPDLFVDRLEERRVLAAPVIGLPGGAVNYVENDAATVIDGGATVADDSLNFNGGSLTVTLTANGTANDRLAIRDQGAGANNISLNGTDIRYDFGLGGGAEVIGTFAGGTGVTPLVISFNSTANVEAAEALMRNITYENVSDAPSTNARTVEFILNDGDMILGGDSNTETGTINVAAENDQPTVPTNTGTTLNEGGNVTVTTAMLNATDPDDAADQLTYTVTAIPGNGELQLSGVALVMNETFTQDDIDNNRVTYVHDGGETTTDSFDFSLADGGEDGTTAVTGTFNFTITAVNDDPVITTSGGVVMYTENDSATIIDGGVTLTDSDSSNFDGGVLTVSFSMNGTANDQLAVNNEGTSNGQISISGSNINYNPLMGGINTIGTFSGGTGGTNLVITLNSDADIEAVQALLRNITYENLSDDPSGLTRTVQFVMTDGDGGTSAAATRDIQFTVENDQPAVPTNTGAMLNEGGSVTITMAMLNATDVDDAADQLTYTVTATPINGELRLNGVALAMSQTFTQDDIDNNRITYVHDDGETSMDSFGFSLADGGEDGTTPVTGTFDFTITAVNDQPAVTTNTGATLNEGGTVTITTAMLQATDPDDAATGLTYTVTAIPANGTLHLMMGSALTVGQTFTQEDIDNGDVTYVHDGTETTMDSFDFSLADGGEDGTTAVTGTFSLTINAVNDDPVITTSGGVVMYTENDPATIIDGGATITDSDSADFNTGVLTVSFSANGTANDQLAIQNQGLANGQISIVGNIINYNPLVGVLGPIGTFSGGTGGADLVITLNANADTEAVQALLRAITYENTSDDPSGLTRTVQFEMTDGDGGTSAPATRDIQFTVVNDQAAVTTNTGASVNEDGMVTITTAMLNATDVDDSATGLTYTVTAIPANGELQLNGVMLLLGQTFTQDDIDNNRVTYVHDGSETTVDSFDFSLADGGEDGTVPVAGTFNIMVTPVNDQPAVATNTGATLNEGGMVTVTMAMLNATDDDDAPGDLTYTVTAIPANGMLFRGGMLLAVNDTFTQADINNNLITYTHDGGETTMDSFGFSLADGGEDGTTPVAGTFDFTITPVNDQPAVTTNLGANVNEGGTVTITMALLNVTDPDDAPSGLTYTVTAIPANGMLQLSGVTLVLGQTFTQFDIDNGDVTYVHDGSETTMDSFGFSLADGGEDGTVAVIGTFDFTIAPVNDQPVIATNVGATLNEGGMVTVTMALLNATDDDDAPGDLTYTVTAIPANGMLFRGGMLLAVNDTFTQADINNNLITYTHDGGETTMDSFGFSLADGGEDGTTPVVGTFDFTITPVNDQPAVTTNTGANVNEGGNVTITTAMLNATDPDDMPPGLNYTVTVVPANGTLQLMGNPLVVGQTFTQEDIDNGDVTYVHDGSETTSDSFRFSLADGGEDGTVAVIGTFNITVTPVNDPPTLTVPGAQNVNEDIAQILAAITVADVEADAIPGAIQVTLSVNTGTLTLTSTTGLIVVGNGTGMVTATGTSAALNAVLDDNLVYQTILNSEVNDLLTIEVSDLGQTGIGGILTTQNTVTILVTPVNDAPETFDVSATFDQDNGGTINLNVTDPDSADNPVASNLTFQQASVAVVNAAGTAAGATGAGLLVNNNDGTFTFDPNGQFVGLAQGAQAIVTFTYTAMDAALTSNVSTVTITVTGLNDMPIIQSIVTGASGSDEGSSLTLTLNFNPVDVGDTHTVNIQWGDSTSQVLVAGGSPFSTTHVYVDDPPGTVDPPFTISTFVTDNFGLSSNSLNHLMQVNNVSPFFLNATASDVSAIGETTVSGFIMDQGVADTHTLQIDWGDGSVSNLTFNTPSGMRSFTASHTYFGNPDPNNPAADIPITLIATDDDGGSFSTTIEASTPGQGLQTPILNTTPALAELSTPTIPTADVVVDTAAPIEQSFVTEIQTNRSGVTSTQYERLVLRRVLPNGEESDEVALHEDDADPQAALQNLKTTLSNLPPDHYRIYLIREDGTERLVLDIVLKRQLKKPKDQPAKTGEGELMKPPDAKKVDDQPAPAKTSKENIAPPQPRDNPVAPENGTQIEKGNGEPLPAGPRLLPSDNGTSQGQQPVLDNEESAAMTNITEAAAVAGIAVWNSRRRRRVRQHDRAN